MTNLQKAWVWFWTVQLIMLVAMIIGWFVLIPFCLAHAWKDDAAISVKDGRKISVWKWGLLNRIAGNKEDGASGKEALVNGNRPYMPNAWAPWRAYLWSGWRNSVDNLKYEFADPKGPLLEWKLFGRPQKIGYQMENGFNVPVISL